MEAYSSEDGITLSTKSGAITMSRQYWESAFRLIRQEMKPKTTSRVMEVMENQETAVSLREIMRAVHLNKDVVMGALETLEGEGSVKVSREKNPGARDSIVVINTESGG